MIRFVLSVIIVLLVWGCGPSPKDELLAKMTEVKQDLHDLGQRTPGDSNTEDFLTECNTELNEINGLLVEGDAQQGLERLALLAKMIERFDPLAILDEGPVTIRGTVEFIRQDGTDFIPLTQTINPARIRQIRTGIRSAAEIVFDSGLRVRLRDQTEINLDGGPAGMSVMLLKGSAFISQNGASSNRIILDLFQGRMTGESEVGMAWLNSIRYVSAYRGTMDWSELASDGQLTALKGLVWREDGSRGEVDLPPMPILEKPVAGDAGVTFYWTKIGNETFQIQISKDKLFSTRALDKSGLFVGKASAQLPAGEYFWRVCGVEENFVPGPWSKVQQYRVMPGGKSVKKAPAQKKPGPPLNNINLEVISDMVIVTGKSQPDARVTINGNSAFPDSDGSFRVIINFTTNGNHKVQVVAANEETGAETVKSFDVKISIR